MDWHVSMADVGLLFVMNCWVLISFVLWKRVKILEQQMERICEDFYEEE